MLWALSLASEGAERLSALLPRNPALLIAVDMARLWARGDVKMMEARRAILDCHALAKATDDPEAVALCHAVGQACSTVHTTRHAMGYPAYEFTAIVRRYGVDAAAETVEARVGEYERALAASASRSDDPSLRWAAFLG